MFDLTQPVLGEWPSRLTLLLAAAALGLSCGAVLTANQSGCPSNELTAAEAQQIVERVFKGVFALSQQGDVNQTFQLLDLDGDGEEDFVAIAEYVGRGEHEERAEFNIGNLGYGSLAVNAKNRVPPGAPINSVIEGHKRYLFLLVLFGDRGRCWKDAPASRRYVIRSVRIGGPVVVSRYRGPVLPLAAGDGHVATPPALHGDAVVLDNASHSYVSIVYWMRGWLNWYPFSIPQGADLQ